MFSSTCLRFYEVFNTGRSGGEVGGRQGSHLAIAEQLVLELGKLS